jgi:hypothetical protein
MHGNVDVCPEALGSVIHKAESQKNGHLARVPDFGQMAVTPSE